MLQMRLRYPLADRHLLPRSTGGRPGLRDRLATQQAARRRPGVRAQPLWPAPVPV